MNYVTGGPINRWRGLVFLCLSLLVISQYLQSVQGYSALDAGGRGDPGFGSTADVRHPPGKSETCRRQPDLNGDDRRSP